MNKQPIILVGGGGHCISCIDVIEQTGLYEIIGILDQPSKVGDKVLNYSIIGTDDDIPLLAEKHQNFLITIGQIKSSKLRVNIYNRVKESNGKLPVIISPNAYVSKYALIEEGTIIMHDVLVNPSAKIGKGCIINSKALIEHEVIIGDFCHISTSTSINGQVIIENNTFIGSNAVVANNVRITKDSIISAGSNVLKDIDIPGVYIGNSLKK